METAITAKIGWFKKQIGLRFDMRGWFLMSTEYSLDINNPEQKIEPADFLLKQIHCAAISYCIQHKKNIWFDFDTIRKWGRNVKMDEFEKVRAVITLSSDVVIKEIKAKSDQVKKK